MYNICIDGGNTFPVKGKVDSPEEKFFTFGIFRKKNSKCLKLMAESYICDDLNKIYEFFFIFFKKKFEIYLVKKSSGGQDIDLNMT